MGLSYTITTPNNGHDSARGLAPIMFEVMQNGTDIMLIDHLVDHFFRYWFGVTIIETNGYDSRAWHAAVHLVYN